MLATFTRADLAAAGPRTLSDPLERGRILYFPECPLPLPTEPELAFLRGELPRHLNRKNVSYYPGADHLVGVSGDVALARQARAILREHSERVRAFLHRALPDFTAGSSAGTSSFRPLQERGRDLKPHASNELVHVDAGAYGATHGGRILRFFVNVNPTEERRWATRGTFPELWERHGKASGVGDGALDLTERAWDKARSSLLGALARVGVRRANVVDSSPYDRAMRKFHNFMKDDARFRDAADGYQEVAFPPFSAWAVLTDMVSHACLSGQHALVDTYVIPLERCALPELAPFHVMQRARA